MEQRFSRTELIIGKKGLDILASSTVAVFGLGGVGSFSAEALARAGIGKFILVDFDTVAPSNINRQLIALEDTVGLAKVDLVEERIQKIHPQAQIFGVKKRFTGEGAGGFFAVRPDYVVDAIDDLEGKTQLIKHCLDRKIPVVSCMGAGNKLDPTRFKVDDLSKTSVCPLARAFRRRLRQEGIVSGLKVVFSTEPPCRPVLGSEGNEGKRVPGSISFVPPVAGMILAGVVIRDLLHCDQEIGMH